MTVALRPADLDARYRDVPAVVCGGSGFIGAWVVRALVARGARVDVVVRDAARVLAALPDLSRRIGVRVADLARPGAVTRVLDALRPAVVFNLAGYGVDRAERDAAIMTALNDALVLELATWSASATHQPWSGVRLLHVGSALEYGPVRGHLHESTTPQPTTDYGRSKLAGTGHVARCGERDGAAAVVARLFTVFGPGEHPGRLLPSLQAASSIFDASSPRSSRRMRSAASTSASTSRGSSSRALSTAASASRCEPSSARQRATAKDVAPSLGASSLARRAAASQPARPGWSGSTRTARATAAIIRPFQAVTTLSSRCGRGRRARTSNNA